MSGAPAGQSRSAFPLIAVDIGNSATKIGLFLSCPASGLPTPSWTLQYPTGELPPEGLLDKLAAAAQQLNWRVVSVQRKAQVQLSAWIAAHRPTDPHRIYQQPELPIAVRVDFPERVGRDRLAAAIAANRLRTPGAPAIVIGAGTAVTVDLVSTGGAFEGGAILPGFRMSAEALARAADLLPLTLLEPQAEPPPAVGKNTAAAIRSGLFWGAVGAVRELVGQYRQQLHSQAPETPPAELFLTGGDLARFAPLLGSGARFVPGLALAGVAISAASE